MKSYGNMHFRRIDACSSRHHVLAGFTFFSSKYSHANAFRYPARFMQLYGVNEHISPIHITRQRRIPRSTARA